MKLRIYLAAPLADAPRANDLCQELRSLPGVEVCSSWHWKVMLPAQPTVFGVPVDQSDSADRRVALYRNLEELGEANLMLLSTAGGGTPRATLVELGWALAQGLPIIWQIGRDGTGANLFTAHDAVTVVRSREEALTAVRRFREIP